MSRLQVIPPYFISSLLLCVVLAKAFEHRLPLKRNQARKVANVRLKRNKMNDLIEPIPLLYIPLMGLFIHARRLFVGRECPYNYYTFEEYSPPPWTCSPFGATACLGCRRTEEDRPAPPLVTPATDRAGPGQIELSAKHGQLTLPMAKPTKTTEQFVNDYSPKRIAQADSKPKATQTQSWLLLLP
jgi:hypothetical protein